MFSYEFQIWQIFCYLFSILFGVVKKTFLYPPLPIYSHINKTTKIFQLFFLVTKWFCCCCCFSRKLLHFCYFHPFFLVAFFQSKKGGKKMKNEKKKSSSFSFLSKHTHAHMYVNIHDCSIMSCETLKWKEEVCMKKILIFFLLFFGKSF